MRMRSQKDIEQSPTTKKALCVRMPFLPKNLLLLQLLPENIDHRHVCGKQFSRAERSSSADAADNPLFRTHALLVEPASRAP